MPQILVPPAAFLISVGTFAFFLAPNETGWHVLATMIAQFGFHIALAVGGSQFGAILWRSLASLFGIVAIWSIVWLRSRQNSCLNYADCRQIVFTPPVRSFFVRVAMGSHEGSAGTGHAEGTGLARASESLPGNRERPGTGSHSRRHAALHGHGIGAHAARWSK